MWTRLRVASRHMWGAHDGSGATGTGHRERGWLIPWERARNACGASGSHHTTSRDPIMPPWAPSRTDLPRREFPRHPTHRVLRELAPCWSMHSSRRPRAIGFRRGGRQASLHQIACKSVPGRMHAATNVYLRRVQQCSVRIAAKREMCAEFIMCRTCAVRVCGMSVQQVRGVTPEGVAFVTALSCTVGA